MKATVNPTALLKELKKMSMVIRKNPIIPIMSSVLFEFTKDKLTITGTDLETTYITSMECACKSSFSFPVSFQDMVDICGTRFTPIELELKGKDISLVSGKWKSKLSVAGGEKEFPKTPIEDGLIEFDVDGDFFYHLSIASTCKHKDDPRINMPAIHVSKDKVNVLGTDSNVMYIKELPIKANKEVVVMVSGNFANACKLFQESKVSIGEKFIKVEHGDETIISLLSEQKFPNYKAVIRQDIVWNMVVNKDSFKTELQSISVGTDLATRVVDSVILGNKIKMIARNTHFNKEAETEFDVESEMEELEISFNSEKMMHFLTTLTAETLDLSFTTPVGSIYIKPSDDDSVFCLLQPVAIKKDLA